MNTILKLLHKKLDDNIKKDKHLNERKALFETVFKEDKLTYDDSDAFAYYRNEIMYRGIMNKRAIEDAYFQGLVKMNDFYNTLDYREKQRMMNYEIIECLKTLESFEFDDTKIYIPFFDEKMNRIYQNEIVLFDLHQYRKVVNEYNHLIVTHHYGVKVFESRFSSLVWVAQFKELIALFDPYTKRLFFIKEDSLIDFITLKEHYEMGFLQELSSAYFYEDKEGFVKVLVDSKSINAKIEKKLNKIINRK